MSLFRTPLVVLDTETTGFESDPEASVWDIGAVLLDVDGAEVAHFEAMGCPLVLHERMDEALAIGGMTREQLAEHPPIADAIAALHGWLAEMPAEAKLTAFNIGFDEPMLARAGFVTDRVWAPCVMTACKPIMGDAGCLPWYRKYNDWKMPKLSEAATFFKVEQQLPAHRALADARTAGLIAVALVRRVKAMQAEWAESLRDQGRS